MIKKLMDYQIEILNKTAKSLSDGHKGIMVQSPPRSGKTVVMAEMARRATLKNNRVLFVVHRQEIVEQVKQTFVEQEVNMDLCQIGMVQTITRRVEKIKEPKLIFIDEAHHALAKTYTNIINQFPNAAKLYFTGTPWRLNGKGFENIADDLIVGKPIQWLIDHQRLADIDYYAPNAIDTSLLKKNSTGDYSSQSIDEAVKPKIYGNAVKNYLKLAQGKQAIAYCYNVDSAEKLAASFNKNGISAQSVSGKTPKAERNEIIKDYREGKIIIVTNAELFTEGLDLPNVDCVIQMRPTESLSLYLQFSMRAMNYRKDKTAIIIDHVGNVERFGLPTDDRKWSLKGWKKINNKSGLNEDVKGVTVCEECFATFYRKNDYCPFCNALLKNDEEKMEVDENAELVKIQKRKEKNKKILENAVMRNVAGKTVADLKNYAELQAYAELNNYKAGWVFYQAKMKGLLKK